MRQLGGAGSWTHARSPAGGVGVETWAQACQVGDCPIPASLGDTRHSRPERRSENAAAGAPPWLGPEERAYVTTRSMRSGRASARWFPKGRLRGRRHAGRGPLPDRRRRSRGPDLRPPAARRAGEKLLELPRSLIHEGERTDKHRQARAARRGSPRRRWPGSRVMVSPGSRTRGLVSRRPVEEGEPEPDEGETSARPMSLDEVAARRNELRDATPGGVLLHCAGKVPAHAHRVRRRSSRRSTASR